MGKILKEVVNNCELQDMIDDNIINDPEEELWARLKDYLSREINSEEKQDYAMVIYTLNEKFGYTFGQISQRTGGTKKAGTLAIQMRKSLGQESQPRQKKAIKAADKKIGELIGKKVQKRVETATELGEWVLENIDPIAKALDMTSKKFISESTDYYIIESLKMDKLFEEMIIKVYQQGLLIDKLSEVASPNFINAERIRGTNRLIEFSLLFKAHGIDVPPGLLQAYFNDINEIK